MNSKLRRLNSFDKSMANQDKIEQVSDQYANDERAARLACRKLLSELKSEIELRDEVKGLRLATLNDLHLVVSVNAKIAESECGINPMAEDSEGFINRCASRIIKKRVWVLVENGELIFKADVRTETSALIRLEEIYVNLEERETRLVKRRFTQPDEFFTTRTTSISQVGTLPSFIHG